MNPAEPDPLDERLGDLLSAYDEALAVEQGPDRPTLTNVPPELEARLQRARACLYRLERRRPRALPPAGASPPP